VIYYTRHIVVNWLMHSTGSAEKRSAIETALHHIGGNRAAQTAAVSVWKRLASGMADWQCDDCYCFILGSVHERICDVVREKAAAAAAAAAGCGMLIDEALPDCIHPHADTIYRSAAAVRVSSSFDDDEINKLCVELWCPMASRQGRRRRSVARCRSGPEAAAAAVTPAVRVMPTNSASRRCQLAELVANRSKTDRPGSGREPADPIRRRPIDL